MASSLVVCALALQAGDHARPGYATLC